MEGIPVVYERKTCRGVAEMQLYMCGRCHAFVTGFLDASRAYPPRYCPNCGSRIEAFTKSKERIER